MEEAAAEAAAPARTTAAACLVLRPSVVPMSMNASLAALLLGSGSVRPRRLAAETGAAAGAWTIFMVELSVCSM